MNGLDGGRLILLNGPSSSGKSTLASAIQEVAETPFLRFSLDLFFDGDGVLPHRRDEEGPFAWDTMRPRLFDGYFGCLAALLVERNDLVVDFIIESGEQYAALVRRLSAFDVFLVGVHCPLPELERRERERGDRPPGDAARDLRTVHSFTDYDLEIDSREAPSTNARRVLAAWNSRKWKGAFALAAERLSTSSGDQADGKKQARKSPPGPCPGGRSSPS